MVESLKADSVPAPPHDPEEVIVTVPRPAPAGMDLEEYCRQNPYTEICGYGATGGMMTCPYSGESVSRAEDCPEFGGGGGGGSGGGGCSQAHSTGHANSGSCGPDEDAEDEREETARQINDCVATRTVALPPNWSPPTGNKPSSLDDVELQFENLPSGRMGEARKAITGDGVKWITVLDTKENKTKASSLGATYEQVVAHNILHEFVHHLYGGSESFAERKAREWYKLIYGAPSPSSSEFQRGVHGKGGTSETDPCG